MCFKQAKIRNHKLQVSKEMRRGMMRYATENLLPMGAWVTHNSSGAVHALMTLCFYQ